MNKIYGTVHFCEWEGSEVVISFIAKRAVPFIMKKLRRGEWHIALIPAESVLVGSYRIQFTYPPFKRIMMTRR